MLSCATQKCLKKEISKPELTYGWLKDSENWIIDGKNYSMFCMTDDDAKKLMIYIRLLEE